MRQQISAHGLTPGARARRIGAAGEAGCGGVHLAPLRARRFETPALRSRVGDHSAAEVTVLLLSGSVWVHLWLAFSACLPLRTSATRRLCVPLCCLCASCGEHTDPRDALSRQRHQCHVRRVEQDVHADRYADALTLSNATPNASESAKIGTRPYQVWIMPQCMDVKISEVQRIETPGEPLARTIADCRKPR